MKKLIWFVLAMLISTGAAAEKQLIDRIVAVVEDQAIFASDIESLVKQYMLQQGKTDASVAERREIAQQVLVDLINDKLIIAQAGRLGVTVPFSDVEKRVDKAIEDNEKLLGGKEAFEKQLDREGFTMESLKTLYREQVHNRMLVERVLEMEISKNRTKVGDEDLRAYYKDKIDQLPRRPAVVHLKTIFVGFATSEKARLAALDKVNSIHRRILAGESFESLARAYSDDPSGQNGGDLGFVNPSDLRDPEFASAVQSLDVGNISEPVLTSYGYHIIRVTEKKPDTGEPRVSHILVQVTPSDEDIKEVFESANAIRQDLLSGAPFDSLADRYNTDPTAGPGGDLGWLKVADLPEFFRDVLADLTAGSVSGVLRESTGFRIVKLVEREAERPYKYAEITSELRRLYEQDQMSRVYADYVSELRKKFTVDLKP